MTFRDDRYGRLQLGKGSSAADDTAEYDLSLVAGPIMYAGVADIAGGIIFTDGTELANFGARRPGLRHRRRRLLRLRRRPPRAASATTARCSARSRARSPTARTTSGPPRSRSAATTATGAAGRSANFTLLAAASVYNPEDDNVDYAYAASGSVLHDPTGLSLTLSTGGQKLDDGDDPSNLYAKLGWDTEFWPLGPTGLRRRLHPGDNISGDGDEGLSYGLAAVQRIERYGIDLYSQLRWYDLDSSGEPDLKNIIVGTFGTKFTF